MASAKKQWDKYDLGDLCFRCCPIRRMCLIGPIAFLLTPPRSEPLIDGCVFEAIRVQSGPHKSTHSIDGG